VQLKLRKKFVRFKSIFCNRSYHFGNKHWVFSHNNWNHSSMFWPYYPNTNRSVWWCFELTISG